MARTIQPIYGPDLGAIARQSIGTFTDVFGNVRRIQRENEAQDIQDRERFARESSELAASIRTLPVEQKIQRIKARFMDLKGRDIPSATTERLLGLYQSGLQEQRARSLGVSGSGLGAQSIAEADAAVEERYQLGLQRGYIKLPEQEKKSILEQNAVLAGFEKGTPEFQAFIRTQLKQEPGKQQFRIATADEKRIAGITDESPYQISPQGKFVRLSGKRGPLVTVNTGEIEPGKIPSGQALTMIDGVPTLIDLPGGPQAKAATEAEKKTELQRQTTARTANIVQEDINRLSSLIEDAPWYNPVTGITGSLAANIPGTARTDAEALKTTIGANIGFDRLQAMRNASKTGGALGAISEREMRQLESVMGSVDLNQSDEQLQRNLGRLNKIYAAIMEKANAYPIADEFGFGAKAIEVQQPAAKSQTLTPEQLIRYE